MRLDYLSDFVDLANTLNFSASAKNQHVSQSTLSRHIQALEKQAGTRLFDRSKGKVALTEAGKMLYLKALQIEDSLEEFATQRDWNGTAAMRTVFVSGQTILPSVNLFLSTMAALARHQNLPLQLQYRGTHSFSNDVPPLFSLDLLEKGEIDLAIETMGVGSCYFEKYHAVRLFAESLCFVVSLDNPLLRKKTISPADLDGYLSTYLEMFPKTRERYGTSNARQGFDPLRIDKVIVTDALEVSAYLCQLQPNEIVQFPSSLKRLFPFGAPGTNCANLIVDKNRAYADVYLFHRKDLDPAIVDILTDLAQQTRREFVKSAYEFLATGA